MGGCLIGLAGLGSALIGVLLLVGMLVAEPWTLLVLVPLLLVVRWAWRRSGRPPRRSLPRPPRDP